MKRIGCKLLSILLAVCLTVGVFTAFPASFGAKDPYKSSGNCGAENPEDVKWYAFDDNSMVLLGNGAVKSYQLIGGQYPNSPWYSFDNVGNVISTVTCTKIVIESGITAIGDYDFYLPLDVQTMTRIKNIDFSDTVTSIGKYAFYNQQIENLNIPPSVKHIGANAFGNCSKLMFINYYGDPAELTWDSDGNDENVEFPESRFSTGFPIHILNTYTDEQVTAFKEKFRSKNLTFINDLNNPYALAEDGVDRNIALYYGSTNSNVFLGASPYIIVGKFDGNKKSTTYGSNGFLSCVMVGGKYYLLTNASTGELREITDINVNGRAEKVSDSVYNDLSLEISHQYIGNNIVEVIYTLKNNTASPINEIKLGGTGDIKIGADDRAAVKPLSSSGTQRGFYMSSSNPFDQDSSGDYATLGFIANNISKDLADQTSDKYPDATYFYGKVGAIKSNSATGARDFQFIPERIFEKNTNDANNKEYYSFTEETFPVNNDPQNWDAGMSYYWDDIDLAANAQSEYAVLFSIYGNHSDGAAMVDDLTADYHTVTWKNDDGTELYKQIAKNGVVVPSSAYAGETPTKPRVGQTSYNFSGWSAAVDDESGNITYTAQYTEVTHNIFKGHSLTLRGDIGVYFYVDVNPTDVDAGDVTIRFDWDGAVNTSYEHTLTASDRDTESPYYYKAKCNVCAAEMTDNIHATAYINGVLNDETDDYSVREYGMDIIACESEELQSLRNSDSLKYSKLVDLVKAMLDYGTKAQVLFEHNNSYEKYANKDVLYYMDTNVTKEMINTAINSESENEGKTKSRMKDNTESFGLTYYGSSVVYLTQTSLRHYYTIYNQEAYESAKESYNNESSLFTLSERKLPYVYFETTDIPAAKLDKLQPFTIGEHTYYYSVLDYAKNLINEKNSQEEINMGMATYWYNHYANEYYNNLGGASS